MSANIAVETKNRIQRIEIDRTEKKNALTTAMYAAMADALLAADADAGTRVILIHGKPDCFTAGNDLKDFLERPPHSESEGDAFRFIRTIATTKKPIVAAVGGAAVGIGTTMLLHCELVYAAPGTRFQLPFVSLGLVPEAASSYLLPAIAGYQRAAELLLLAQPFGVDKALAAGFVTEVIPEGELLEYARDAAAGLAALPPASVQLTKRLMKRAREALVAETMAEEGRVFRERLPGPEAREAMTAFFEKRKPDFSRF
ncbi:MAG: enoyl-CoA hydratase/isomerase family protein [Betaproteobacteria bacterium]|nr:enoyl-CoA hydratase/isomerase family protein [Betaproteobacteria bacterium]